MRVTNFWVYITVYNKRSGKGKDETEKEPVDIEKCKNEFEQNKPDNLPWTEIDLVQRREMN